MWGNISAAPADAIMGLTEAFIKDTNPNKVNLGVGVYKDDNGTTPVLDCVKKAEQKILEWETSKTYLPISGSPEYCRNVQELIFGEGNEVIASQRAITVQAPGGTSALRIGGDLLKKFRPDAKVWISSPSWTNHKSIFAGAGFAIEEYPYYDAETGGVDFSALLATLKKVSTGDIVLLHVCCHNPTGVDLSVDQWNEVVALATESGWIPFLDFAYQGFGEGLKKDRQAVELFAAAGIDFFVASSFSKNFGLYCERAGALTIACPTAAEADVAMSHLKKTIRVNYSNPPAHGARIVETVLRDAALRSRWLEELNAMHDRIVAMRTALVDGLAARGVQRDFSFIKRQHGMFSFSGLSDDVVAWLRENRSIYIVSGGRINVAGITSHNIEYVCDSIAEALKH